MDKLVAGYLDTLKVSYEKFNKKLSDSRRKALVELMNELGCHFSNILFLDKALTHRSWYNISNKKKDILYNQRLEFLGDSILDAVISQYLFCVYPFLDEGALSRLKSSVVSRKVLSSMAYDTNLPAFVRVGKTEKKNLAEKGNSILGDTMEALIGAYMLDTSYDECREFILKHFIPVLEKNLKKGRTVNYKSMLQEISQKKHKIIPEYRLDNTSGPGHKKEFQVSVYLDSNKLAAGKGFTKKEAEVKAAQAAIETHYSDAVGVVSMLPPAKEKHPENISAGSGQTVPLPAAPLNDGR